MKSIYYAIIFFIMLAIYSQSNAQNLTTSVQGVLRDAVGHSVEDGAYTLVFKLYTVDNGGIALWTETQENVVVTHGVFSIELGSVTSMPNINAGQVYYLGIAAEGGAEMQPRAKLHKAFAANVTAAMAGFTNNVPSSGLASLDSIKFSDNTKLTTADPSKLGIPIGGIIMWSGSAASVPSNWKICNGSNGTPDLRDRFIVGAGSTWNVGNTGGISTLYLSEGQLPPHYHTGSTNSDGSHSHGFNDYTWSSQSYGNGGRTGSGGGEDNDNNYGSAYYHYTDYAGSHSHSFSTNNTGSGQGIDNKPPYYALYYIMKISN